MLERPTEPDSSEGLPITTSRQRPTALNRSNQTKREDSADQASEGDADDTLPSSPNSDGDGDNLTHRLAASGKQGEFHGDCSIRQ
jgi:hypothetical protein